MSENNNNQNNQNNNNDDSSSESNLDIDMNQEQQQGQNVQQPQPQWVLQDLPQNLGGIFDLNNVTGTNHLDLNLAQTIADSIWNNTQQQTQMQQQIGQTGDWGVQVPNQGNVQNVQVSQGNEVTGNELFEPPQMTLTEQFMLMEEQKPDQDEIIAINPQMLREIREKIAREMKEMNEKKRLEELKKIRRNVAIMRKYVSEEMRMNIIKKTIMKSKNKLSRVWRQQVFKSEMHKAVRRVKQDNERQKLMLFEASLISEGYEPMFSQGILYYKRALIQDGIAFIEYHSRFPAKNEEEKKRYSRIFTFELSMENMYAMEFGLILLKSDEWKKMQEEQVTQLQMSHCLLILIDGRMVWANGTLFSMGFFNIKISMPNNWNVLDGTQKELEAIHPSLGILTTEGQITSFLFLKIWELEKQHGQAKQLKNGAETLINYQTDSLIAKACFYWCAPMDQLLPKQFMKNYFVVKYFNKIVRADETKQIWNHNFKNVIEEIQLFKIDELIAEAEKKKIKMILQLNGNPIQALGQQIFHLFPELNEQEFTEVKLLKLIKRYMNCLGNLFRLGETNNQLKRQQDQIAQLRQQVTELRNLCDDYRNELQHIKAEMQMEHLNELATNNERMHQIIAQLIKLAKLYPDIPRWIENMELMNLFDVEKGNWGNFAEPDYRRFYFTENVTKAFKLTDAQSTDDKLINKTQLARASPHYWRLLVQDWLKVPESKGGFKQDESLFKQQLQWQLNANQQVEQRAQIAENEVLKKTNLLNQLVDLVKESSFTGQPVSLDILKGLGLNTEYLATQDEQDYMTCPICTNNNLTYDIVRHCILGHIICLDCLQIAIETGHNDCQNCILLNRCHITEQLSNRFWTNFTKLDLLYDNHPEFIQSWKRIQQLRPQFGRKMWWMKKNAIVGEGKDAIQATTFISNKEKELGMSNLSVIDIDNLFKGTFTEKIEPQWIQRGKEIKRVLSREDAQKYQVEDILDAQFQDI